MERLTGHVLLGSKWRSYLSLTGQCRRDKQKLEIAERGSTALGWNQDKRWKVGSLAIGAEKCVVDQGPGAKV